MLPCVEGKQGIMKIDIGIDAAKREEIANGSPRVLADTYTLYLKTAPMNPMVAMALSM